MLGAALWYVLYVFQLLFSQALIRHATCSFSVMSLMVNLTGEFAPPLELVNRNFSSTFEYTCVYLLSSFFFFCFWYFIILALLTLLLSYLLLALHQTTVRSFVMWVLTVGFLLVTGNDVIGKREHWPILFGRAVFGFVSVSSPVCFFH